MKTLPKIRGHITDYEAAFLAAHAARVPEDGIIVEIGSYCGKSAIAMALASHPFVDIYAVDMWEDRTINGVFEESVWLEFLENIRPYAKIHPRIGKSEVIGQCWNLPINLLFVDGDHTEHGVTLDLLHWFPHVVKGGVVLLHDYSEPCGVQKAWLKYVKTLDFVPKIQQVKNMLQVSL